MHHDACRIYPTTLALLAYPQVWSLVPPVWGVEVLGHGVERLVGQAPLAALGKGTEPLAAVSSEA